MIRTFDDLDSAIFEEVDVTFTSFAYLIAGVRALSKVLVAMKAIFVNDRAFSSADTELTNWKLHLPVSKKELIRENGLVDQILFQAHMVVNAYVNDHYFLENTNFVEKCNDNASST